MAAHFPVDAGGAADIHRRTQGHWSRAWGEFWESQRWLLESEDALEADWHSSHRQGRGRAVAGASVLLRLAVSQMYESDMDQVDAAEGSQIRRDSAQKRAARWIETALAMRG